MSTDPYSQDGVLKNKFGEKDPRKLEILEKRSTIRGWIKLQNELIATPNLKLDASLIKKIHKNLFDDVYDWAGEYRTVNIVKGKTMFANALYVPAALEDLVTKLNRDITSKSITSNNVGEKLAYYYGELNMIHPFREGNGRTQRIFIEKVADKLGYSLQLEKVDSKKLLEVTIESVNGTGKPLKKVFEEVIVTKHFKSQSEQPHINSKSITSTNVTKNNYDLER
ncbi:Fic family protein [Exiguobacterium sp. RIT594]|uniref:Fic/DOC family protein n=1 Tax=Exiguobacterium sp. RIT594 TaxID=2282449 RepID=UPI000DF82FDD|nr:Fic family protein [Exiguobacterium sp. RIT594]RDB32076.1 cell filamentation protein Fic [Exiguobacterium sp. RIT594]